MFNSYNNIGINIPDILIPRKGIDLNKWAVVACDQYSSQPEYWQEVEKIVGESESSLRLILPEVYLGKEEEKGKIDLINKTMRSYIREGTIIRQKPGFVFVDRKTPRAESRKGLVAALDLEKYDYNKGSQTLIRATEGTDVKRLPPRVKIRENAYLELPHIMVLIDDPKKTVIEPLADNLERMELLYDFDLMMNGGHIKGFRVDDREMLDSTLNALEKLAEPGTFRPKYGVGQDKGVLLFAVGDGNHSLASAKVHWENLKKTLPEDEAANHPARFALVEIVNVHDEGLRFEPIHRVVFNISLDSFVKKMDEYYKENSKVSLKVFEDGKDSFKFIETVMNDKSPHYIPFRTKEKCGAIIVENPRCNLEVGTLQFFLDELVKNDLNVKVDYIHGEEVVDSLGAKEGNIGFYLPDMDKYDLFKTVIIDGALPKKTFSMGEAEEKRFYLECRKIKND